MSKEEASECLFCGKRVHGNALFCDECLAVIRGESAERDIYSRRGGSVRDGYLQLFEAIRLQAIEDKKLDDFEAYWIKSKRWCVIWNSVREALTQKQTSSIESSAYIHL